MPMFYKKNNEWVSIRPKTRKDGEIVDFKQAYYKHEGKWKEIFSNRNNANVQPFKDQSIKFKASRSVSNVNFFNYNSLSSTNPEKQVLPDLNDFTVFINDEITNQKINDLSFNRDDIVEIKLNNPKSYYPYFYCRSTPMDPMDSIPMIMNLSLDSGSGIGGGSGSGIGGGGSGSGIGGGSGSGNGGGNGRYPGDSLPYAEKNSIKEILKPLPLMKLNSDTNISQFNYCFEFCNLTSIPENLFVNNPDVISFIYCFSGCSLLTSIPENLFANNPNVTNFDSCFGGCSLLTSIPENLFANNPNVTVFNFCFNGCISLTGKAPEIWNTHTKVIYPGYCFLSCESLSNYNDIPDTWK